MKPVTPRRERAPAAPANQRCRNPASAEGECEHQRADRGRAAQREHPQSAVPLRALLDRLVGQTRLCSPGPTDVEDGFRPGIFVSTGQDDEWHGDDFVSLFPTDRSGIAVPWDGVACRAAASASRSGAQPLPPRCP